MTSAVRLNGEPHEFPAGASVADAVAVLLGDRPRDGVAVAVDGAVVRRSEWASTPLAPGAHVEVLTAMQGG